MSTSFVEISDRLRLVLDQLFPSATLHNRALELGVHVNSLAKYLRGERLPSADTLHALIRCGVDVTWILSGEGTPFMGGDEGRKVRLRELLSKASDKALANEWERRLEEAITEGLALLQEVSQSELEPLAKKLRAGPLGSPKLSPEAMYLLLLVRRAYRALDRVLWWFGDLDTTMRDRFRELLDLHERATADPSFRTLLYEAGSDPNLRSLLAGADKLAELTELAEGKNLGMAARTGLDDSEPVPVRPGSARGTKKRRQPGKRKKH